MIISIRQMLAKISIQHHCKERLKIPKTILIERKKIQPKLSTRGEDHSKM